MKPSELKDKLTPGTRIRVKPEFEDRYEEAVIRAANSGEGNDIAWFDKTLFCRWLGVWVNGKDDTWDIHIIHPDEGKRVKWECFGETGYGKYLGQNKKGNHIVQLETGIGWTSTVCEDNITPVGTPNCYCVTSYELIEPETEAVWYSLTRRNTWDKLNPGQVVEISREKGHVCQETVERVSGEKLVTIMADGTKDVWQYNMFPDAKFRLIKKATPEVGREVTSPAEIARGLDEFFNTESITKPKSLTTKIMDSLNDITNKAKLIAIGITNMDERLAIENGIKNIDGSYTETFYAIVSEKERVKKAAADEVARKAKEEADKIMYKSYADAMIVDIKAVKAEEKK